MHELSTESGPLSSLSSRERLTLATFVVIALVAGSYATWKDSVTQARPNYWHEDYSDYDHSYKYNSDLNTTKYTDPEKRYALSHPGTWNVQEEQYKTTFNAPCTLNDESCAVVTVDTSRTIDPNKTLGQLINSYFEGKIGSSDSYIISNQSTYYNDIDWQEVRFFSDQKITVYLFTIQNNTLVTVEYAENKKEFDGTQFKAATPDDYYFQDEYDFREIMYSFEFNKKATTTSATNLN